MSENPWASGYVKVEQVRACGNCGFAVISVASYEKDKPATLVHLVGREQRTWNRDELHEETQCPRRSAA